MNELQNAIRDNLSPAAVAVLAVQVEMLKIPEATPETIKQEIRWFRQQLIDLLGGVNVLEDMLDEIGPESRSVEAWSNKADIDEVTAAAEGALHGDFYLLDDLVRDVAEDEAGDVNNEGVRSQIQWLMNHGLTKEEIFSRLDV